MVFEPAALRVTDVLGSLGGPAAGPVLAATSDRHVVTIALSTAQESEVAVGDAVTVTLPDGASTPGKISSVGTVASGTASNATIQVTVTLTHPSGGRDPGPGAGDGVRHHRQQLRPGARGAGGRAAGPGDGDGGGRGYAVEVVGAGDTRRLVPVTVGIFDDNSGLVQVTGALAPGEQVVVPAT